MTVHRIPFGDIVQQHFVMHHCGSAGSRPWYCAPCGFQAANRGELVEHCKTAGEHLVVSWCPVHRWYEEAPAKHTEEVTQ